MKYLLSTLVSAVFLFGIFSSQTEAQIIELRQTVYGMDCAPCAHGLANRISNMEGVESVSVSLNNSLLEVTFNAENDLTLREIQKSVEDSGFQPKEAELKITGFIKKENGNTFVLETQTDEEYILIPNDQEIEALVNDLTQQVVVTGKTNEEEEEESEIPLIIESIENIKG